MTDRAELIKWARDRSAELLSTGYRGESHRATVVADLLEADAARIAELEALVREADCPRCDGSGEIEVQNYYGDQELEPSLAKCPWCERRESLLHSEGTK